MNEQLIGQLICLFIVFTFSVAFGIVLQVTHGKKDTDKDNE